MGFLGIRLASGDDSNDIAFASIAVADQQQTKLAANAEEHKSIFISEWSGSLISSACSSTKTDLASSKLTPCFLAFVAAFFHPIQSGDNSRGKCNYSVVKQQVLAMSNEVRACKSNWSHHGSTFVIRDKLTAFYQHQLATQTIDV